MKLNAAKLSHGWLLAVELLAALSTLLASPSPHQPPRYMTAELQETIGNAKAEKNSSATSVAVFYVSITDTLVPPDFLQSDYHNAVEVFRHQAS